MERTHCSIRSELLPRPPIRGHDIQTTDPESGRGWLLKEKMNLRSEKGDDVRQTRMRKDLLQLQFGPGELRSSAMLTTHAFC